MEFLLARWTNRELHALFFYTPLVKLYYQNASHVYRLKNKGINLYSTYLFVWWCKPEGADNGTMIIPFSQLTLFWFSFQISLLEKSVYKKLTKIANHMLTTRIKSLYSRPTILYKVNDGGDHFLLFCLPDVLSLAIEHWVSASITWDRHLNLGVFILRSWN